MSNQEQPLIHPNDSLVIMSAANGFIVKEHGDFQQRMRDAHSFVFESLAGLHHFTHRAKAVVSDAIPIVRVADLAEHAPATDDMSGILGTDHPGFSGSQQNDAEAIIAEAKAYEAPVLPPHQQRMLAERAELGGRLSNLEIFILTNAFDDLPAPERMDMTTQFEIMGKYLEVLDRRIARFQKAAQA